MTIGTLALTGFPFTAGFYSKDAIIESAFASHTPGQTYAFLLLVLSAFMTSFYSWRLYFMTFTGAPRWGHGTAHNDHAHHHDHGDADDHAHAEPHGHGSHEPHESPIVMLIPLAVLGVGALLAGFIFAGPFIGAGYDAFWKGALFTGKDNHILHEMHEVPTWVKLSPFIAMVLGFALSWLFYVKNPSLPVALAKSQPILYRFLLNKWYFDELYDFLFVRPAKAIGRFLWKKGDGAVIDGLGPDGISARVVDVTHAVVRLQTGYIYHYAFAMLMGVALFVTWYMFGGAH
jgi:NADH-quinone oxidoreductase subunit L